MDPMTEEIMTNEEFFYYVPTIARTLLKRGPSGALYKFALGNPTAPKNKLDSEWMKTLAAPGGKQLLTAVSVTGAPIPTKVPKIGIYSDLKKVKPPLPSNVVLGGTPDEKALRLENEQMLEASKASKTPATDSIKKILDSCPIPQPTQDTPEDAATEATKAIIAYMKTKLSLPAIQEACQEQGIEKEDGNKGELLSLLLPKL